MVEGVIYLSLLSFIASSTPFYIYILLQESKNEISKLEIVCIVVGIRKQ